MYFRRMSFFVFNNITYTYGLKTLVIRVCIDCVLLHAYLRDCSYRHVFVCIVFNQSYIGFFVCRKYSVCFTRRRGKGPYVNTTFVVFNAVYTIKNISSYRLAVAQRLSGVICEMTCYSCPFKSKRILDKRHFHIVPKQPCCRVDLHFKSQ